MTVTVTFLSAAGALLCTRAVPAGSRLLDVAQAAGLPVEGTCNGQMACSTCHLIVPPGDGADIAPPSAEEDDLLDLTAHATRFSRLGCQVWLPAGLERLTVQLPPDC